MGEIQATALNTELSCGKEAEIICLLNLTKLNAQIASVQKSPCHQSPQRARFCGKWKVHLGTAKVECKVSVNALSLGLSSEVVCKTVDSAWREQRGIWQPPYELNCRPNEGESNPTPLQMFQKSQETLFPIWLYLLSLLCSIFILSPN